MSFYLPNPDVHPTVCESAEYLDTIPPEFERMQEWRGRGREETPDPGGAFPRLEQTQIELLARGGRRRVVEPGEVLYREGDTSCDFFVIVSGSVAIIDNYASEDRVLAVHGAGRFLGEIGLLTGETVYATAVVRAPGEIVQVPLARLRELVAEDMVLGDIILHAYLQRRSMLIEIGSGFRIVGSRFSPDTRRLREFAGRNRLPHRWIDVEADPTADMLLRRVGVTPAETPIVIWGDHNLLRNPTNAELAAALGLPAPHGDRTICDLLVVGAGPAGLAAAVYGASEGLDTVVVDAIATGGQAGASSRIENYLGFPAGISGAELAERATIQSRKFGARLTVPAEACTLEQGDDHYDVHLADASVVSSRTVVIATGARYRKLDVPGLEPLEGLSVFYAATEIETTACRAVPVAVVGGGNSAAQATLSLARRASKVYLLVRAAALDEAMSAYLAERIRGEPNVEIRYHTEVRDVVANEQLHALVVADNRTGERQRLEVHALFVFVGAEPHARWLADHLALDDRGFILTGADAITRRDDRAQWTVGRVPLPLETSWPGVFAAGDVRSGSVKRIASAVGEGAMVVRLVHEHLDGGWGRGVDEHHMIGR